MEDLSLKDYFEKYPYFTRFAKKICFVPIQEYERLKNSTNVVKVDSVDIPVEYLKSILEDDFIYEYAFKYFNNEIDTFRIKAIKAGDTYGNISYNKHEIMKGLNILISNGELVLDSDTFRRFDSLKNATSIDQYEEDNKNNTYNVEVDGNKYSIPVYLIFEVLKSQDDVYDYICNHEGKIQGIPHDHLMYAINKYFNENNIAKKYLLSDKLLKRINDLSSLKSIDIEALNCFLITTDTKYKEITIDEELKNEIIKDIPSDLTDLEKAIYIYIKMCKTLTYDEEYYAVNQRGDAADKHKSTDYVSQITKDNNKVVCFEFNVIYSKFLNELGIRFSSNYKSYVSEEYGRGHVNLEFRADKFLVRADSVTSILMGDIMRAKLNQPLVGLICSNINSKTQEEFKNTKTRIYELVAKQEKNTEEHVEVEKELSLKELLEEYEKENTNQTYLSFNKRLSIFFDKIASITMVGVDAFSYVLQLRKALFSDYQLKNNVKVSIFRNNNPIDTSKVAMASAVISINNIGFETHPYNNIYSLYTPSTPICNLTKEEIECKFKDGSFEIIDDDSLIPGIEHGKGVRKC